MPEPYTDEAKAIIAYVEATGLPYRVTDVNTPGVHTASSYHYAKGRGGIGTAVDFAGTIPGTSSLMVAQMTAIWRAFKPVAPQLAELFYQSPDIQVVVKNGAWRAGLPTLGQTTWDAHRNHVHVAVRAGTFLVPPKPQPTHVPLVPAVVYDYEEGTIKTIMLHCGPLDANGNGYVDWQPGLGRDPIPVALTLLGPSPPDDTYWPNQSKVQLSAQPRGGALRVTVRNGTPGDTITCYATVA